MTKGNWLRRHVRALFLKIPFSSAHTYDSSFASRRLVFRLMNVIRKADFSPAATLSLGRPTVRGLCSASSNSCSSIFNPRRQRAEQHAPVHLACADRSQTWLLSSSGDTPPPYSCYGTLTPHSGFRQESRWKRDAKRGGTYLSPHI